MKARLLVHVIENGECVHQELPEVEFDDFGKLDNAIQVKWNRIESVTTGPKDPHTVLFRIWRKCANPPFRSMIQVMQVILLNDSGFQDHRSVSQRNHELGEILSLPV